MSIHEPSAPPLQSSVQDGVATLMLNRSEQRNALHPELIRSLSAALGELAGRGDVGAIVLTAHGPAFCAGLDLRHLSGLDTDARVRYMRTAFALFEQLHDMPQPTIAAVNGPAVAGGFDLAVFCDLRLCTPAARFAQPEVILGVTQFLYPLYTIVGLGRARELALTGTSIDAAEAYRIGLVNHLVAPDALLTEALRLARTIASRPREAVLATKRLGCELPGVNRGEAFRRMGEALDRSLGSEAHRQALSTFLERDRNLGPDA